MQDFVFSLLGTAGAFIGVGIAVLGYLRVTKKDRIEKITKEVLLYDSVDWLKKQFGEKPNGGGIMEQLSNFMEDTRGEFVHVKENQQAIALDVVTLKTLQSEHARWHENSR